MNSLWTTATTAPRSEKSSSGATGRPEARRLWPSAPLLVLYILALFLIPADQVVSFLPFSLRPSTLIAIACALLLCCLALGRRNLTGSSGAGVLNAALLLTVVVLLWSYASASLSSLKPIEGDGMDRKLVVYIVSVLIAFYCYESLSSRWMVDDLLFWIVAAITAVAVIALIESAFSVKLTDSFKVPLLSASDLAGIGTNSAANDRGTLVRAQSTTAHPIELGVISAAALPLVGHLFLSQTRRFRRMCLLGAGGCITAAAVLSISRSAIVSIFAAAVIFTLSAPRNVRVVIAKFGLPLALLVGVIFLPAVRQVYSSFFYASSDFSIIYRTIDYSVAYDQLLMQPLLGHGPGTWIPPVHNIYDNSYLLILSEQGAIGLLAFLFLVVSAVGTTLPSQGITSRARVQGSAIGASLAALALAGATFDLTTFDISSGFLMIMIGCAGAVGRLSRQDRLPLRKAGR